MLPVGFLCRRDPRGKLGGALEVEYLIGIGLVVVAFVALAMNGDARRRGRARDDMAQAMREARDE